ncbi:gas vesicle protein GvpO [Marinisporobacter balticus]|uniref:Gas vesicle protein GvpO n=1 Tax=Marinisporobacter balticus TaxID=2018667 RepID=A0A4R2L210_9FIRM|nr:gas vesicle protein GvpO [Marinisporobacter balticus]TCO77909.1 gas vesicle protein GvpO [Marinisporobacter balticus]
MSINVAIEELKNFFYDLFDRDSRITSIMPSEDGYDAELEIVQEDEYMRKRGRKDIIAVYEAKMDNNFKVISYNRKELKERGSIE